MIAHEGLSSFVKCRILTLVHIYIFIFARPFIPLSNYYSFLVSINWSNPDDSRF